MSMVLYFLNLQTGCNKVVVKLISSYVRTDGTSLFSCSLFVLVQKKPMEER